MLAAGDVVTLGWTTNDKRVTTKVKYKEMLPCILVAYKIIILTI